MTPGAVFVDSAAFVALVSVRDAWHDAAKAVMAQLAREQRTLLTSDLVLTEFLNTSSRVTFNRTE